jgi:hypothetical protein
MATNVKNPQLEQAMQNVGQAQQGPGLLGTIKDGISNFMAPPPGTAQMTPEVTEAARQMGVDPQALLNQMQSQQMADREIAETPQVQDSVHGPQDFVAPPQAQQPTQAMQPGVSAGPSQDISGGIGASFNREQAANKAAAEAGALKAQEQAAFLEKSNEELAKSQAKMEQMGMEMEQKGNEQITKLQEVQQKMQDFKFQDFWENKSTGQKVLAGIAIALGGIGAAYQGPGAKNGALEIINQAIDRDLNQQKLNLDKLGKEAEGTKGILAAMNQQFDNRVQAESAARAILLQRTQNELARIATKYESPELQAKAQVLNEQLERQKIATVAAFKQQAQIQELLNRANSGNADMRNLTPAQVAQIDKVEKGFAESYVPGYGRAINKDAALDFSKYRNEIEPAINGAKRIMELSKNFNRITDQTQRAKIQTELAALVGQLRLPFTGPGAMTDKEYDRLAATIGDPTKFAALPAWERAKLQTVLKKLETDLGGRAKNAGLTPAQAPDYSQLGFKPR